MFGFAVTAYLFLAGLGAGLYLTSSLFEHLYMPHVRRPRDLSLLYQKAQIISLVSMGVGVLFLLADLTRPTKLFLAFRGLGTSILSLGSLFIVLFIVLAIARIAYQWAATRPSPSLERAIGILSSGFAACIILYTGFFLMQMKAVPFWNNGLIVALFTASSLSSGLALFALFSMLALKRRRIPRAAADTLRIDHALIVTECAALFLFILSSLQGKPAAQEACLRLLTGDLAWAFWSFLIAGLLAPLVIGLRHHRRKMSLAHIIECICILLGCFLLRFCIMTSPARAFAVI